MIEAQSAFQTLASAISKFGFLFIPAGLGFFWFANSREFASSNTKRKIMDYAKLSFILFAAFQLPIALVWLLNR